MANPYKLFKTNPELEMNGVTSDFGGMFITIARSGGANKTYQQVLSKRFKPYRSQLDRDTIDPDLANKIYAEVFASTIVKGWSDVTDEDDNPLPFTFENCVKLFLDLPDLFAEVQKKAADLSLFREEEVKAISGN
jgi:hypothetical protein